MLPSDNQTLQWTISHLCTSMTIHKNLHLVRGFPRQPCSEGSSHFELNPAQRRLWVVLHHSNGKIHVSTQVPSRHSPSRPGHWTRWTHAVFQGVHPHEKGCSIISSHVTVYIYIYIKRERERGGRYNLMDISIHMWCTIMARSCPRIPGSPHLSTNCHASLF